MLHQSSEKTLSAMIRIILVLILKVNSASASVVNVSSLIRHYIQVCGVDHLCNRSFIDIKIKPDLDYFYLNLCPPCSCGPQCLENGNCCPDLFFSLPTMECDDLYILEPSDHLMKARSPEFQIASRCPPNTERLLFGLCNGTKIEKLEQKLTNVPVTGSRLNIAYRNKYCAECNNDSIIAEWNLDIDCKDFADFNFLSSYEEIVYLAEEKRCGIRFVPGSLPVYTCPNASVSTQMIGKCNVTGNWLHYDQDIASACESTYDLRYRIFKNIFCYICNPSKYNNNTPISKCNLTNLWQPIDKGLENSCHFYDEVDGSQPYKNVFCYLCNKDNINLEPYLDMDVNISEYKLNEKSVLYYHYLINTTNYKQKFLFQNVFGKGNKSDMEEIVYGQSKSMYERILPDGRPINITRLVRKHFSHGGTFEYCSPLHINPDSYFLPVFQPKCGCGEKEIFKKMLNPCIDMGLRYPSTCYSTETLSKRESNLDDETRYIVTNGCYRTSSLKAVKEHCETIQGNSIYWLLPITIASQTYSNLFCSMCNNNVRNERAIITSDSDMYIKKAFGIPWNVEMHCDTVLDYSHYATLYEVLVNARDIDCRIKYVPKNDTFLPKTCTPESKIFHRKCNFTGYWSSYDPDVEWACENTDHDLLPNKLAFKNIFCKICNPKFTSSSIITECNITGKWEDYSPNLERACAIFPRVDTSYPFKNMFCERCNGLGKSVLPEHQTKPPLTPMRPTLPDTVYPFTFRNIFSLLQYDPAYLARDMATDCDVNQVFDVHTHECRNITCYPGKRLGNNDSCDPLLRSTSNLRYVMAFGMKGKLSLQPFESEVLDYTFILREMKIQLINYISQNLNNVNVNFHSYSALGNLPCNAIFKNDTYINILLNYNLFVKGFVDRKATEEMLLAIVNGNLSLSLPGVKLNSYKTKDSLYLPSHLNKADLDDRCFEGYSDYLYLPHQYFKSTFVDEIMLCEQLEFTSDEYEIDTEKMTIKLTNQNKELSYDKYKVMPNGNIRVCLETLKNNLPSTENVTVNLALSILTLVCVGISILCLIITFLTYCIFSVLRTLPGKNLMLLTFTIFSAQVCFLLGFRPIKSLGFCITRGIFSHLFWLASFGCMNVCSFHMYQVFGKSKVFISGHQQSGKTFIKYIIYSYLVPLLFCIINIIVHLVISGGKNTGYGGRTCFINHKLSLILTFLVPVTGICLSNIILFSITVFHIWKTPRIQSNKPERREFFIYIKLFVITGILSIFQIIDSFFPLSVFSFIVTVLVGLQGFFLFLSYICTSRIVTLYKNALCKKKAVAGTHTTSYSGKSSETKTTTLSVSSDGIDNASSAI